MKVALMYFQDWLDGWFIDQLTGEEGDEYDEHEDGELIDIPVDLIDEYSRMLRKLEVMNKRIRTIAEQNGYRDIHTRPPGKRIASHPIGNGSVVPYELRRGAL